MADWTPDTRDQPPRRRRRRRTRRKSRRRLALVLVLLAALVGAGLLAPDLIQFVREGRPGSRPAVVPARTTRPLALRSWGIDFSMGPILELIEQQLRLDPFDLRRPLRIPFVAQTPAFRGSDILLYEPAGFLPPLVPGDASPLPPLPEAQLAGMLPQTDPAVGLPTGEPDFDPALLGGGNPPAEDGEDPKKPKKPKKPKPPKEVPEPAALPLLASGLAALTCLRRRRQPAG